MEILLCCGGGRANSAASPFVPFHRTKKRMSCATVFRIFSLSPLLIVILQHAIEIEGHRRSVVDRRRIDAVLSPAPVEKPDALRQAWQELLELRTEQNAHSAREFPVDRRLLGSLRKCGTGASQTAITNSALMLGPGLFRVYAEIGHLTRICPERVDYQGNGATLELPELMSEFRRNCTLTLSAYPEYPSLAQIFGTFGAHEMAVAQSDREHKDLQHWAREVVQQIHSIPDYDEHWKLVLIAPGLHDIRPGKSPYRLAQAVLQSVHVIRHRLPRRTFLLILRPSYFSFWHTLARGSSFCAKALGLWNWEEHERVERAWEEVEARLSANFQSEDFHVEIADLMDQGRPLPGPGGLPDVSVLGPDCAHLSARGLSLLHAQLWNWLLQPQARVQPFVPLVRPLLCPRPHCPFLLTSQNRLACPRLPSQHFADHFPQSRKHWSTLSPLALFLVSALLLYALLVCCTFASQRRQEALNSWLMRLAQTD